MGGVDGETRMGEVRFYHLTETPLEAALPVMLEACVERGWRALVRGADRGRLAALDAHLWSYRDDGFLPHGLCDEAHAVRQPVLLTDAAGNPNAAVALFLVDGAAVDLAEAAAMTRVSVLFDGHDGAAVESARKAWRALVGSGMTAAYWAQEPGGRWVRKAESGGKA